MKRTSTSRNWLATALAGLALAFATGSGLAAPDLDLGTFDADLGNWNGPYMWGKGWGSSTVAWDATEDNTGNGGGSVHISGPFDRATSDTPIMCYGLNGGNPWAHSTPAFDLTVYKSLEFDIKWDTTAGNMSLADFNNPPGGGDRGLPIHACQDQAVGPTIATTNIPDAAANGWTHMSIPINPAQSGLGAVYGIFINKWLQPVTNPPASFGFWIDNVVLKGGDVLPPPTIAPLAKPIPGLAFIAASGGQYDRQEIRTVGSNYTWVGASGPVSYSMDVVKLGENNPAGFTLFVHLIPGIAGPDPGSDYAETNVLMLTIVNDSGGGAWASLHYKTNAPASNGNMFTTSGSFNWAGVWNPTPVGTWTLTFDQNTNVTITAPGGGTFATNLPPEVVAIFNEYPNMQVNFGAINGDLSRLGQMAVVTGIKITGTAGEPNVESDFLNQPLDTNTWMIVAASPKYGVQQITKDAAYWLNWTLPANGFSLQTKATLDPGTWTDSTLTGYDVAGFHHVLLNKSDLPGSNSSYFRLIKRVASQLQVLLPGETNAPNTTTGKIGTPDPQTVGNPFDVTINACDPTWHIVSSSDTVAITSSDTTAWLPGNATLANGTVTITGNFYFGSSGTWTVTATDVTAGSTLLPNTSTAITIP